MLKLFQGLRLTKRTLLGYADTEGVPHRGDGSSSLWDFCIIFKHIVAEDTFEILEDCFHVCHVTLPKHQEKSKVKKTLEAHFQSISHLQVAHRCDDICLCFWNSPHDMRVLGYYDMNKFAKTVDLLKCARARSPKKYESFSINKLCSSMLHDGTSIHTGLGDTLRMISILPKVGISHPKCLLPYINEIGRSVQVNPRDENVCKQKKKGQRRHHSPPAKTAPLRSRSNRVASAIRRAKSNRGVAATHEGARAGE